MLISWQQSLGNQIIQVMYLGRPDKKKQHKQSLEDVLKHMKAPQVHSHKAEQQFAIKTQKLPSANKILLQGTSRAPSRAQKIRFQVQREQQQLQQEIDNQYQRFNDKKQMQEQKEREKRHKLYNLIAVLQKKVQDLKKQKIQREVVLNQAKQTWKKAYIQQKQHKQIQLNQQINRYEAQLNNLKNKQSQSQLMQERLIHIQESLQKSVTQSINLNHQLNQKITFAEKKLSQISLQNQSLSDNLRFTQKKLKEEQIQKIQAQRRLRQEQIQRKQAQRKRSEASNQYIDLTQYLKETQMKMKSQQALIQQLRYRKPIERFVHRPFQVSTYREQELKRSLEDAIQEKEQIKAFYEQNNLNYYNTVAQYLMQREQYYNQTFQHQKNKYMAQTQHKANQYIQNRQKQLQNIFVSQKNKLNKQILQQSELQRRRQSQTTQKPSRSQGIQVQIDQKKKERQLFDFSHLVDKKREYGIQTIPLNKKTEKNIFDFNNVPRNDRLGLQKNIIEFIYNKDQDNELSLEQSINESFYSIVNQQNTINQLDYIHIPAKSKTLEKAKLDYINVPNSTITSSQVVAPTITQVEEQVPTTNQIEPLISQSQSTDNLLSKIPLGNLWLTINVRRNTVWIGVSVIKDQGMYYTTRCVPLTKNQFNQLLANLEQLKDAPFPSQWRLPHANIVVKKDIYKGKEYYSLRQISWYKGEYFLNRKGFNLRPDQFDQFMSEVERLTHLI